MKREIGPNEIALGDHPCCTGCGMPMIAEIATANTPPDAKEPR